MIIRRVASPAGRRLIFAAVVFALIFASVTFLRSDDRNYGAAIDFLIQKKFAIRNEIEEVEVEEPVERRVLENTRRVSSPSLLPAKGLDIMPRNFIEKNVRHKKNCIVPAGNPNKATFDVSNMTYSLKMGDLNWDGDVGVWDSEVEKQFQLAQTLKSAKQRKLKVFVVPFSHSDPGWLMTVDQYLTTYTQSTLDLMLQRLKRWPDMTFIWAEVSFFELWWGTIDDVKKQDVRDLVASGRLEIVNGGYVMPDEASTHYYAILHQYVYGHQWLRHHLNTTPRHGFSIDPFGYSSTMPYLLKNLGFQSIFIQRIHYIIRKRLVHAKASQFSWQQPWDVDNSESMFTYMSHATLYDIKHTCGQDNAVCAQFDYMFQDTSNIPSIAGPAKQLLEQFRKTSHFYPHDVVLFPIGMDFRWSLESEWDGKHAMFRLIMDHLNNDSSNNIEMKFGTYNDYYKEVFRQMGTPEKWKSLPSVTGDFFPYADRTVEYWTGYYTSHPFQKALNRDLENHLRTAEILFVLARMRGLVLDIRQMLPAMELAAKSLGLYQHHDAITGTSKQAVSDDYEKRLFKGITDIYDVIQYVASTIVWPKNSEHEVLVLHNTRLAASDLPSKRMILVKDRAGSARIVVLNSLASVRFVPVDVLVDTEHVVIRDSNGVFVPYQASFALDPETHQGEVLPKGVRLTFIVEFKSTGMKSFTIGSVEMKVATANGQHLTKITDEDTDGFSFNDPFVLENSFMQAAFSPSTGLLESITDSNKNVHPVRLEFKRYETMKSGAYLFWPYAIADMVPFPHGVRLLDGHLYSEIHVILPGILRHVVRLFKSPTDLGRSLHVENTHNLMAESNLEAVMRFSTQMRNNFEFYTDSNGFQMVKRRASHDLPMQANYFPATTMAFLQDKNARLTLHLGEAHGVGSQDIGQIEVMLDRVLLQDDARGVEEPLKDPRTVRTALRIQLETEGYCRDCLNHQPTSLAHRVNQDLNNPAFALSAGMKADELTKDDSYSSLMKPLPCNVHLVMLKPVSYDFNCTKVGVVLHRFGTDCTLDDRSKSPDLCPESSTVDLPSFLNFPNFVSYNETTLNFIDVLNTSKNSAPLAIEPMKIVAVTLTV